MEKGNQNFLYLFRETFHLYFSDYDFLPFLDCLIQYLNFKLFSNVRILFQMIFATQNTDNRATFSSHIDNNEEMKMDGCLKTVFPLLQR